MLIAGAWMLHRPPEVRALVALDYAVWRVVDVHPLPEEKWTDDDWSRVRAMKPGYRDQVAPTVVVLRPVQIVGDDPRARDHDRHTVHRGWRTWHVFPDEHYPLCSTCGEPYPCRERENERIAEREMAQMARFETTGVCPACAELITHRQKSVTFPDNVKIPAGPPVTFHTGRRACLYEARQYESQWLAADPNRRQSLLEQPRLDI